jgi:hypothetical protein
MTPTVIDNDQDEITVTFNGKVVRSFTYDGSSDHLAKMLQAREYVEGWYDGQINALEERLEAIDKALERK